MRKPNVIESSLLPQDRQAHELMGVTQVTDQSQTEFHRPGSRESVIEFR